MSQVITMPGIKFTERDTVSPGRRAKACFEVTAGIVPGTAMPEHTRRWLLTSETFHSEMEMSDADFKAVRNGVSTFVEYRDAAYEYARTLVNPKALNWVRVDWIWF